MLWILVKKQFFEIFKGYFYDSKRNRMRSKVSIALYCVMYALIMLGVVGGTFTGLSLNTCGPMHSVGMDWLYFDILGGIALALGCFASVFNSYTSLYMAKDNDLMLSLPIPAKTIVLSRLINVYILGAMYSAMVLLPMYIVYFITAGCTLKGIFGALAFFTEITALVLIISCAVGRVIAALSAKLSNKKIVSSFAVLIFMAVYLAAYSSANAMVYRIAADADNYGQKIRGSACILYIFGKAGEGEPWAVLIVVGVTAVLFAVVARIIIHNFLKLTLAGEKSGRVKYKDRPVKQRSVFSALLMRELSRFASSTSYMLNSGLGILMIPVCGVVLLFKGPAFYLKISGVLTDIPDSAAVILCAVLCMAAATNDMATPSVSLEGKNLWISQSLPVKPGVILRTKALMQLILTAIPVFFASVCAAVTADASLPVRLMIVICPLCYTLHSAAFDTMLGVKMPILNWTNEMAPIKQSGAVLIALFGGWIIGALPFVLYFLIGFKTGAAVWLLLCSVIYTVTGILFLKWLDTKGAEAYASL